MKHWCVAVSQQPFELAVPHTVAQSVSAVHFTVSHSGGGGGGGGFVALPVPFGAGSVAGASWVAGPVPSSGGSEEAHAAINVPAVRRATA